MRPSALFFERFERTSADVLILYRVTHQLTLQPNTHSAS